MGDNFGKSLVYLGLAIAVIGLIVWGLGKLGIPLGRLPGDIRYKSSFYFPIVSSIIISVILTIILNVVIWLMRK